MTLRLPLRALPLAIRVARAARRALERLHDDLESMVEPVSVDDLRGPWTAESISAGMDVFSPHRCNCVKGLPPGQCDWCDPERADLVRCFECGTSDPTGFCPAHRVLDKGRVN